MHSARRGALPLYLLIHFAIHLSPAIAAPPADDPLHADLSGLWVLNSEQSDDPAAVIREARSGGGGGRGGGGRGGGGRGGGGRGGGGQRQDDTAERPDQQMAARIARLEIFHDDLEFNLTDGLDISRLLYTDGRESTVWTEQGEMKATAIWQGETLVVTWQGGRGGDRTTRLSLAENGQLLLVREQMNPRGQDRTVTLDLVYDRQK